MPQPRWILPECLSPQWFLLKRHLEPLVRNWDWVRSSNHIHRVPRKTIYVGIAPVWLGLLCRSGLAVRTAGEHQQGNQRSSQLRWFIFVQIAYWQMRSNVLKWVGRSRLWRPKFPLYHATQILSSVILHKFWMLKIPFFVSIDYCNLPKGVVIYNCSKGEGKTSRRGVYLKKIPQIRKKVLTRLRICVRI